MNEEQYKRWLASTENVCQHLNFDADETTRLVGQLEFFTAQVYETEFAELTADLLFPADPSADVADETYSMRNAERNGKAEIIANWETKLSTASYAVAKRSYPIRSIADGYILSIQDLRSAAKTGINLDTELAEACKIGHAELKETLCFLGDAPSGVNGLFSAANNVTTTRLVAKVGVAWDNVAATFAIILADFIRMWDNVVSASKGRYKPTTFAVGTKAMLALTKPMDMGGGVWRSPWELILASYGPMGLKELIHSPSMDTIGAASKERVMLYVKDPKVVASQTPEFFTQLAPQLQGLTVFTACHSRIGGVHVEKPMGIAYMDGCIT